MCDHTKDPGGREEAMIVLERNQDGKATVFCDPCIAPLVRALNNAGMPTVSSCCGHGRNDSAVALRDGRWLIITDASPIAYKFRQEVASGSQATRTDFSEEAVYAALSVYLDGPWGESEAGRMLAALRAAAATASKEDTNVHR